MSDFFDELQGRTFDLADRMDRDSDDSAPAYEYCEHGAREDEPCPECDEPKKPLEWPCEGCREREATYHGDKDLCAECAR